MISFILALEIIKLVFESQYIVLNKYHYYPSFCLNIISVGLLVNSNYEITIKRNFCDIILNGVTIMRRQLNNGIYIVSRPNVMYISNKYLRTIDVMDAYLWHYRLGHIDKNRMNRLDQEKILDKDNYESLPTCKSCLLGKMTKSPFTEKGERASNVLDLIHTDVLDLRIYLL